MTGGNQRNYTLSNDNKRFCRGNAEIYATTLVDAKLEQEALFTFMGVQNKSIKKHF
jgi:hypothetical protein